MKKIPTLFERPEGSKLVVDQVREGCEWVIAGEGVATIKYDGSCCMVRDGKLYARYQAKTAPTPEYAAAIGFIPSNEDGEDGHRHGWRLVDNSPNDQYHREAWQYTTYSPMVRMPFPIDWTYELVGPRVQANPYSLQCHALWRHGEGIIKDAVPTDFDGLRYLLSTMDQEGIVWWRNINDVNCDKVKIKRRDFGLPWPVKQAHP